MTAEDFRELIKNLCEATDAPDWERIADDRHLIVNDCVVGLAHDSRGTPDVLGIVVDLGERPVNEALALALLSHNAQTPAGSGYFALLPGGDRLVYRIDRPWLVPIGGAELATELATHVEHAQRAAVLGALL